ncbi:MAG: carbohydrate ABC transporter permease [Clostridiales bacterium]|jgi:putative aldouronate transport system permease protein|nr:carbohydrate ABC transporter permease [Clostridiales bacterium]MBQ6270839.1 carbohydrate ABC transporter permease [Clostridiales bacterium]MBR4010604.1 carbohydrate ABC transporter permease [Clostridiales bacterium]
MKVKENKGYKIFLVVNTIIMILISAATLFPFLYLVAQSLSSESAILEGKVGLIPRGFNLNTYKVVITQGDFLKFYKNTVIYTLVGTTLSLAFSSMLAYPLSKKEFKPAKFLTPFVIFTMYFGGGMIPNYILVVKLGLNNTMAAFILPMMISTYYVLLMKSFFASTPKDLEEAGELDGLNKFGVFLRVVLPLSKPIIATMTLFYAVMYWNNWFQAFLYLRKEKWPVAYYLQNIIRGATQTDQDAQQVATNIRSCSMVLTALPIICVYPFIQKYYVQGMMLGGVKE